MSDEATTVEVVDAIPENLALAVKSTGLDTQAAEVIEASFAPLFVQANKWAAQVAGLKVTDVSQVREMKLARESRLALKEIRVLAGKNKDRLKEDSLKRSRAVDSVYNAVKAICEPLEAELLAQEQFALRAEAARLAALKAERENQLRPFGVAVEFFKLDEMPAEQFAQLLESSKATYEAKIAAERKAEADRIAKEKAEIEERARIAAENERLKAEAIEREKAAQAERERVAAEKRAADEKARIEREKIEAEMRKQREEADRKACEAAAAAKAEREAAEAKARAEQDAIRKQAQAEREAREKAEAEAKRLRDAEAARIAAEEAARKKAARAPDREKVRALAATVRSLPIPQASTTEGAAVVAEIAAQVEKFAAWLEKKGAEL